MRKCNKLLKVSSIFYLLYAIAVIMYSKGLGGFLLTIGIFLLTYSFLDAEHLQNKKVIITIIGIISIFINLISAVMLFIALDDISSYKRDNDNAPPETEITSEAKRIDMLLKIGLGMIIISGILVATSSWENISDILKVIGLLLISGMFIFLSKFTEEKLNIKKTAKIYYLVGLSFILFAWISVGVFGIISEYFTYSGAGSNLVYLTTFALLAGLLYLLNKKYSAKEYLYFAIVSCYLCLYHLLAFIGLDILLITLIFTIVSLLINIFVKDNKYQILSEVNNLISYLYTPIIVAQSIDKPNILVPITSLVAIVNVIYYAIKQKDSIYNTLSILTTFTLLLASIMNFELASPSIIIFITTTIIYVLINHNKYNRSKFILYTNQVLYNIIATFTIFAMDSALQQVIFSVIYGIINHISCYITNEEASKIDFYYQPFIIFIIIGNFLNVLHENLFEVLAGYHLIAASLTYSLIHKYDNHERANKIYYTSALIATMASILINFEEQSVICSIISIILSLYLYKASCNHNFKNKNAIYILLLISIFGLSTTLAENYLPAPIASLILLIVYVGLTFLINDNTLKKVNYISIAVPLYCLVNSLTMNEELKMIFYNIFSLYILFLVITFFVKKEETKDLVAAIGTAFIVLGIIFEQSILLGIYIGLLGIGIIIYTYNKKVYKKFYYTGITITIINIIIQLGDYWSQIPLPIYFLLLGLSIVGFVTYKEMNKNKNVNSDEEEKIEVLDVPEPEEKCIAEFCPFCGTKNPGGNFCLNCGHCLIITKKKKK